MTENDILGHSHLSWPFSLPNYKESEDSIQLNLDPVAPLGLNGQNLAFEPITILTSRCKCFTFIGGV